MKYADKIEEPVAFLLESEKKRGSALDRARCRFLRLLKTGECKSQAAAGAAIGLCERHAQRLWQTYRQHGFEGLMQKPPRRGFGKLTARQISHLRRHQAQLSPHYDAALEQLHDLLTTRNRLIGACNALSKAQNELAWADAESHRTVSGVQQAAIEGLNASIRQTEQAIDALLEKNSAWRKNFELATSIRGVGKLTVLWLMVHTRNFDPHFNARKVAALVGIAPYETRSGTSVNAGTHVSKFGHLDVKALLHMAAMSSIRCNEQVKGYYKRKKNEGKPGLLVLNNIKNKIVHQILAVVRSQVPYDPAFVHPRAAD